MSIQIAKNAELSCIGVSVVSHGQGHWVHSLLRSLEGHCQYIALQVVLVLNIAETLPFSQSDFFFPLQIVHNPSPKGFAANHNAAFALLQADGRCDFFCVVNPDVRLTENVFLALLDCFRRESLAGVAAPLVKNSRGKVESTARPLPTPLSILAKALGFEKKQVYPEGKGCIPVDWVAGMFMLFPAQVFAGMGGFDERYFLYYEDVDICCRLQLAGYKVMLAPSVAVIHDAQRDSHRRIKYFAWHLASMLRFFTSPVFFRRWRQIRFSRRREQQGG